MWCKHKYEVSSSFKVMTLKQLTAFFNGKTRVASKKNHSVPIFAQFMLLSANAGPLQVVILRALDSQHHWRGGGVAGGRRMQRWMNMRGAKRRQTATCV